MASIRKGKQKPFTVAELDAISARSRLDMEKEGATGYESLGTSDYLLCPPPTNRGGTPRNTGAGGARIL